MRTRTCVYDIETMAGYFSAAFVDINTDEKFIFEVYKVKGKSVNQIKRLLNFLDTCKGLIGYNNLFFDYPVLHELLVNREFIEKLKIRQLIEFIYQKAQTIITKQNKARRKISKDKMIIPQLDLMYMNYFNSKSRFVSLKQMEFVMRYHNVQDMPYDHRFKIKTVQQANEIASYNFNDVDATLQFYKMCMDAIVLRRELTRKYKMDLMTEPNTNLAKEIFATYLLEDMKISRTELNSMGTLRDVIDVEKEVILPIIKFEDDRLNKVVEFFKLQKVTYLKGFFTDIDKRNPGYSILREISNPNMIDVATGVIESFNVLFKDHTYVFGSGGIHSKIEGKSFVCKDHQIIVDADVRV